MKIVYIAGLGHSGSTVLDMSLGCHPKMIGLGEVSKILHADKDDLVNHKGDMGALCSCGHPMDGCEFWKGLRERFIQSDRHDPLERYGDIAAYVSQEYGRESVLVDSSKKVDPFLVELDREYQLKVIVLVRDIRSWCHSRQSRLGTPLPLLAWKWLKNNHRVLKMCKENRLDYKVIGYEEMALYPEMVLKKISEFIGIDYDPAMLCPDNTNSHIMNGNVAKGDSEKRKGIIYDARWLTSLKLVFFSFLISPLLTINRKLVYSNFMKGKTRAFGRVQDDFAVFGQAAKEKLIDERWGVK